MTLYRRTNILRTTGLFYTTRVISKEFIGGVGGVCGEVYIHTSENIPRYLYLRPPSYPHPTSILHKKWGNRRKYAYFPIRKIRLFVLSKIRLFLPLSKLGLFFPLRGEVEIAAQVVRNGRFERTRYIESQVESLSCVVRLNDYSDSSAANNCTC